MKLYFVRHGESTANILHEFSNSGWKHPLTDHGVEQVQTLAVSLASKGITRLYSSPVMRAVQTAEILSQAWRVSLKIDEALREWSVGILEGTRDPKGWEMQHKVMQDWFVHRRLQSKIAEGESFLEIQARFVPFINKVVEQFQEADEQVVLVGHGGLYIAMLPVILQNIGIEYSLHSVFPNTGYVLAEIRQGGLYCLEWCGAKIETL